MKQWVFAVVLLGLMPGPALAQADGTPGETVPEPSAGPEDEEDSEIVVEGEVPEKDRKVCVRERPTGSIVTKRVCRTQGEIEEQRRRSLETLETFRQDRDTRSHTELSREAGT